MNNQSPVDKSIRRITYIFLSVGMGQFAYVFIDSLIHPIGFEYTGFFLAGLALSLVFDKFNHLEWSSLDSNITRIMNGSTVAVILVWFIVKYNILLPLFDRVQIDHVENAILLLSSGVFLGRTGLMWRDVRKMLWQEYYNN